MRKFLEGFMWTLFCIAAFAIVIGMIAVTAVMFIKVFGDWGGPIFGVLLLCIGGGVIAATEERL